MQIGLGSSIGESPRTADWSETQDPFAWPTLSQPLRSDPLGKSARLGRRPRRSRQQRGSASGPHRRPPDPHAGRPPLVPPSAVSASRHRRQTHPPRPRHLRSSRRLVVQITRVTSLFAQSSHAPVAVRCTECPLRALTLAPVGPPVIPCHAIRTLHYAQAFSCIESSCRSRYAVMSFRSMSNSESSRTFSRRNPKQWSSQATFFPWPTAEMTLTSSYADGRRTVEKMERLRRSDATGQIGGTQNPDGRTDAYVPRSGGWARLHCPRHHWHSHRPAGVPFASACGALPSLRAGVGGGRACGGTGRQGTGSSSS